MVDRKIIIWGELAERQYKKSLEYHFQTSGNIGFCVKLNIEINNTLNLISEYNELGIAIPKTKFRSISVFWYSIVYEINDDFISVLLFWNTRRNPKTLKILLQELS